MATVGNPLTYDEVIRTIAEYATNPPAFSEEAYATARLCLADSLGCALLALNYPACTHILGPLVPGAVMAGGCRVPGTDWTLDPVRGAFNIGTLIRWLDYNDTWLAAEWGHPSDNLGGLLAVSDYLSRQGKTVTVHDLLSAMIQAHEIQGVLALENSFNRVGIDHVILVKVATAAITAKLLGGTYEQVASAISNAWVDIASLRTYRHWPNTGFRKSWAAGDATSRGVWIALMALRDVMGYPTAITAKNWGLQDVLLRGRPVVLGRPLGSYVMENVLFKVAFPAEFHAQTAVECAIKLHPNVVNCIEEIEQILLTTHESAIRIIDKAGPLRNPADRDHCLQYMVAVGMIFGGLTPEHYEDPIAKDPRIDALREKMSTTEHPMYTRDYLDPNKRSISNAVTVWMRDGTRYHEEMEYPVGHRNRREEGQPLLYEKFTKSVQTRFEANRVERLLALFKDPSQLDNMAVDRLMEEFKG